MLQVGQESPLNREVKKSEFSRENSLYGSENPEKDDIYQFGVILLHVITGKLFNSRSEIAEMKLQVYVLSYIIVSYIFQLSINKRNIFCS